MKLLLLGASGLVGSRTLNAAYSDQRVSAVIAPTRNPMASHPKLTNLVASNVEELIPAVMALQPEAVICALGTTQAKAGSKAAFRHVDHDLPVAFAGAARAAAVETFAIVTASGASAQSRFFYYRTKGEVENTVLEIGFESLAICRPSLIEGDRSESRTAERSALRLLRVLRPVLPARFEANPADVIAAALLDAVTNPRIGCRYIESTAMRAVMR